MKLLALDPGGTTGFAVFKQNLVVGYAPSTLTPKQSLWICDKRGIRDTKEDRKELFQLFKDVRPDVLVCENFRLYPWKSSAMAWSQLNEIRIIGACELYQDEYNIPLIMQSTDNRDIGYKWGQVRRVPKSNPANHAYDAEAHAVYYIIKNGGVIK